MPKKRARRAAAPRSWLGTEWLLSIDPGEAFGAALLKRGELVTVFTADHSLANVSGIVSGALERCDSDLGLVVEQQFLGRGAKFNPKTTESLMKRRHTWELVAELRKVAWDRVAPASWQAILKAVPRDPSVKGRQTKVRSMTLACRRWPHLAGHFQSRGADVADAALMGLWYSNQQLREHPRLI